MIIIQLLLYCLLFTAMVKFAVRGGAIDGLYFYPKPVRERATEIGLTDKETMDRKRKSFMILCGRLNQEIRFCLRICLIRC